LIKADSQIGADPIARKISVIPMADWKNSFIFLLPLLKQHLASQHAQKIRDKHPRSPKQYFVFNGHFNLRIPSIAAPLLWSKQERKQLQNLSQVVDIQKTFQRKN